MRKFMSPAISLLANSQMLLHGRDNSSMKSTIIYVEQMNRLKTQHIAWVISTIC